MEVIRRDNPLLEPFCNGLGIVFVLSRLGEVALNHLPYRETADDTPLLEPFHTGLGRAFVPSRLGEVAPDHLPHRETE